MTVATTWKPQYYDVMVNVISLDSTGIRTKCQSQTIHVLWLQNNVVLLPKTHKYAANGRAPSYQTPHPNNTRGQRPQIRLKSCATFYDRSEHVKTSIQWRHIWSDFTRSVCTKSPSTKTIRVLRLKSTTVLLKYSSMVLQHVVYVRSKAVAMLPDPLPTTNAAHGRISD